MLNKIKQYNTYPHLHFAFTDASGQPVDCSIYDVKLVARDRKGNIVIEAEIGESSGSAVWNEGNAALGKGLYRWEKQDTALQGIYEYEFKFRRHSDGREFTIPQEGYFEYIVYDDINTFE